MLILKSVLAVIYILMLSIVTGNFIARCFSCQEKTILLDLVVGIGFHFTLFECLALVLTFLHGSLTLLIRVWTSLTFVLAIVGIYRGGRDLWKLFCRQAKRFRFHFILFTFLALLFFQIFYVVCYSHTDADDATYVGMAVTSYFTDTINVYDPTDGDMLAHNGMLDYKLASFPVFWAMIGKMFGLHPAYLMHTLLPVIFIPLAYIVYYLIAKKLLKKRQEVYLFLFFVALFNVWGNYSIRSAPTFLLFRIWQGKAVLAAIVLPLEFLLLSRLMEENHNKWNMTWLFCNHGTACAVSGMGPILLLPFVGIYALYDCFANKSIRKIWKYIVAGLPCVIIAVLYVVLKYV